MQSNKASEYLVGILAYFPALILIASVTALEASNGGRRAASSYSRHPNDLIDAIIHTWIRNDRFQ
jgi:hypothetical protein